MGFSEFEVITGMVEAVLIIMGVVLMVRLRMLRKALRTRKRIGADESPSFQDNPPDSSSARLREEEEAFRKEQGRERKRFESLIRDAEKMRAELQVLFYDIESLVDELGRMREAAPSSPRPAEPGSPVPPAEEEGGKMFILPGDDEVVPGIPSLGATDRERPLKETVLALSREGHSVPEIAQAIGRSEGEVSFLLSMERVGQSN